MFENYVTSSSKPICREERQYALYLYNLMQLYQNSNYRNNLEELFKGTNFCDKSINFDHIVLEAAFMRDLFERDRADKTILSFNERLLNFIKNNISNHLFTENEEINKQLQEEVALLLNNIEKLSPYNLGAKKGQEEIIKLTSSNCIIKSLLKIMMNVKPDIAFFTDNELYFWECKYSSPESKYTMGPLKISQIIAQKWVGKFLCDSDTTANYKFIDSKKIIFFYHKNNHKQYDYAFEIDKLINLNKELLHGKS